MYNSIQVESSSIFLTFGILSVLLSSLSSSLSLLFLSLYHTCFVLILFLMRFLCKNEYEFLCNTSKSTFIHITTSNSHTASIPCCLSDHEQHLVPPASCNVGLIWTGLAWFDIVVDIVIESSDLSSPSSSWWIPLV